MGGGNNKPKLRSRAVPGGMGKEAGMAGRTGQQEQKQAAGRGLEGVRDVGGGQATAADVMRLS